MEHALDCRLVVYLVVAIMKYIMPLVTYVASLVWVMLYASLWFVISLLL